MDTVEEKAHLFLEKLLTEGAETPCDDSVDFFNENEGLPPFYDEELFRKGQAFFHRNIFAFFGAKTFGLISILSIPSILRILVHTKMSGSEMTAYKRYVATIFHTTIWYDSDFKPGSKLWQSIAEVKNLHNSASKRGCKAGLNRISQTDMALTQFGFMGFQVIRGMKMGMSKATAEDLKGFIHLWRVIGHLLGMEDRFNICRGTVAETKEICEKLVQRVFIPHIRKKDPESLQMSKYLINGLWVVQPILNFNVTMCTLHGLLNNYTKVNENKEYINLTLWEKCLVHFMMCLSRNLEWGPIRWYFNYSSYAILWLMRNFPFLAYYKFGYQNSHVKILGKNA